jgi:hypothetical protein
MQIRRNCARRSTPGGRVTRSAVNSNGGNPKRSPGLAFNPLGSPHIALASQFAKVYDRSVVAHQSAKALCTNELHPETSFGNLRAILPGCGNTKQPVFWVLTAGFAVHQSSSGETNEQQQGFYTH